jgi:hypothetical protein
MSAVFHALSRQSRIIELLAQPAHQDGVCAEYLLASVCRPGDRAERQRWMRAIFALADRGRISVTGKPHRTSIASALVALNG